MFDGTTAGRVPGQRFDSPAVEGLDALRAQAERCRRLARGINDRRARQVLDEMAESYEEAVAGLHGAG